MILLGVRSAMALRIQNLTVALMLVLLELGGGTGVWSLALTARVVIMDKVLIAGIVLEVLHLLLRPHFLLDLVLV
jgi:hypothetical protein